MKSRKEFLVRFAEDLEPSRNCSCATDAVEQVLFVIGEVNAYNAMRPAATVVVYGESKFVTIAMGLDFLWKFQLLQLRLISTTT